LALSLLRPDLAQRADPAVPATGKGRWLLQHLSAAISGQRQLLHGIADHFQKWLKGWTENAKVPVVDAPKGRRDEFVDAYFKRAKPDTIVVVLKAREPARIMIAIGDKTADRWHLELAQRWVVQYSTASA